MHLLSWLVCSCVALFPHCDTSQDHCLGNGDTQGGLSLPPSLSLIKAFPTHQPNVNSLPLRLSASVILVCLKLTKLTMTGTKAQGGQMMPKVTQQVSSRVRLSIPSME